MIKFFRKIRYELMSENQTKRQVGNTGRYFKYAFGEILLVVIGILIALSINNWNEGNKRIKKGHEILVDIKENVEFNSMQFQQDIELNGNVINSIDIILNNITVTKIYNDSIDKHLRFATWWATSRWKSSGYEALIFNGVDIIQSKKLRESIIDLYEISYPDIVENTRMQEGNWHVMYPHWIELVYREPSDFIAADQHEAKPFDYQEIIDSRIFRSFLTFNRSSRSVDIQLRNNAIEKTQELIDLINNELKKN
jgi:Family of unknown function (DUF6090)